MVGLKTFWITVSALLMLASCVPQTKKSECASNEAFNTSLRTCVPVIQTPGQFINISSFTPTTPYQRYHLNTDPMVFRVFLSNPYNRPYRIKWIHNFNGIETTLSNAQLTQQSLLPLTYTGQFGTHTLTAEVLDIDSGFAVVDTQVFVFTIDNTPRPTITANTPANYNQEISPLNTPQPFSITINNNNASTLNYRVRWELYYQSGGLVPPATWLADDSQANQAFGVISPTGSHTNTVTFDPAFVGTGKYFLKGRIVYSGTAIVEERTWDVVVKHPAFGVISSANLPLPSIQTNAYHGVSYEDFAYGFADSSYTKADYCVTVSQPQGSYPNGSVFDNVPPYNNILVRYYKSFSDPIPDYIYEGKTDPSISKNTVCFSDAPAANQDALIWNNGPRELVARVFDEQTGAEMCVTETCTAVKYPVRWNVTVNPVNIGPKGQILPDIAGDYITYTSAGATTRNATVTQDTSFTIRFRLTDEELPIGWDPAVNTNKFRFTGELRRGAAVLDNTTCFKEFSDPVAGPDYSCTFNIPSYDAYGASGVNPPGLHKLVVTLEDADSQVPTSVGQTGTVLTWDLDVKEAQTRPTIALNDIYDVATNAPIGASVDEKKTIRFYIGVNDDERDTYNLMIERCSDSTCNTRSSSGFNTPSTTQSYPSTPSTLYFANSTITYTLSEYEVGAAASGQVWFRVSLTDIPSDPALGLPARTGDAPLDHLDFSITVNNINDIPVIRPERLTFPMVSNVDPYEVYSGNQFSILTIGGSLPYQNAIVDTSLEPLEQVKDWQWFIREATGPGAWQPISGATSETLRWTPGPELSGLHHLSLCVADGFPRTAADHTNGVCTGNYLVDIKSNTSQLSTIGSALPGDVAIHHVPAENLAYVAYVSDAPISDAAGGKYINVEKFTYRPDGTLNTSGMSVVSFRASSEILVSNQVKDLSITASSRYLYISYLSDESGVPGNFQTRIRLINIENATQGTKTHPYYVDSTRKFDFNYLAYTVVPTCAGLNCDWNSAARTITFNGGALLNTDEIVITVPGRSAVTIGTSVLAPTPVGSICANCDGNQQAVTFANAINAYGATNDLQGLSASVVNNVVTIHGLETNLSYNSLGTVTGMGKIVVAGVPERWYLPIINPNLPGNGQNKIQILSGDDGVLSTINTSNILSQSGFENVVKIDNELQPSGEMLVGYTTAAGSALKVINLVPNGTDFNPSSNPAAPLTVFNAGIADFKIRASTGATNPNVFVAAKNASGVWSLARMPNNLGSISIIKTVDAALSASATDGTILAGNITALDLRPAAPQAPATMTDEARVVLISDSGTGYNSHLFRWYTLVTTGDTLASNGEPLELESEEVSATSKLATFPIAPIALGSDGGTVGESTNYMLGLVRTNATDVAEVQILNSEIESIQSTTRSPAGFFHPPYIK